MDLYSIPIPDGQFQTRCGGNDGEEGESCVRVARINDHAVALRDTKNPAAEVRFTLDELEAAGIRIDI